MVYRYYSAAFVTLRMESDGEYLTGLRFAGKESVSPEKAADIPVFEKTKGWLDVYFSGRMPDFTPDMRLLGLDSDTFYIYHVAAVMVDNLRRLLLGINLSDKAIMDFDFPGVGFPV